MKKGILWFLAVVLSISMIAAFSGIGCKAAEETVAEETVAEETVAETAETTTEEVAPAEKYRICFCAAIYDDKWMSYMHQGVEEIAAEISDTAEVIMVDANNEYDTQIDQAEDFIAQQVDALVLVPLNTIEANPIADLCADAGIPLITVNRILINQDIASCYVGSDSLVAGELMMGELAEIAGGTGNVVIIMGELTHEAAINRTDGIRNIMENYPNMEEVGVDTCNWKREESQNLVENWIQSGLEFNIIAANNDEGAIGAILGLQSQNIDPVPYFIGGVDATPDALSFMKDGFLDVTVFQDAFGQGRGGIQAALDIIQGKDVPEIVWIPYELVTSANMDEYIAKWQ